MRVAVCVSAARATAYGDATDWSPWVASPASSAALDAAVRLKRHQPTAWVIALTAGPDDADAILRECLIRGADEAVRVWERHLETGDASVVASALAHAVRELDAGLVLCGAGETPQRLARLLRAPLLTGARSVRLAADGASVTVPGTSGNARAMARSPVPAVVAVAAGRPRHHAPSLADRFRAGRIEIQRLRLH